ncbi:integrase [Siculibacillus lacustris]|uniref:Integrase n=2 Tax=Siculibacillus lacustris TaxID=1549641 RepID=A0A4Q9VH36_9HYPH|nr:integrase [Siculibacillus lacustris]
MSRTPSTTIDTPAKRAGLEPNRNPCRGAGIAGSRGGVTLGDRRRAEGPGAWVAKTALNGTRLEERLGTADDEGSGPDAFSDSQGVTRALARARERPSAIEAQQAESRPGDPTVATAILNRRKGLGIRAPAADTEDPTERRGRPPTVSPAPSTIDRLLNDLRAALDAAVEVHRRQLPGHIPIEIEIGTRAIPDATDARRQIPADADVRSIVEAAFGADRHGDFGRLVLLPAATGARFSQIAKATVADVQVQAGRIMVPPAQKGRTTRAKPKVAVPMGDEVLERPRPALVGRKGHEPLLERWRHEQVGPADRRPVSRGARTAAAEMTRPWKTAVATAGVPEDTGPYALRHSSIAWALRANVPVRIVAARHDTSTAMIERPHSAYVLDATEDLARRALVPLAPSAPAKLRSVSCS